MRKDKHGLSTVVTTLIIILLVIVAIGIIWLVVRNLLNTETGTIDIQQKCLGTNLEFQEAACSYLSLGCGISMKNKGSESVDGFRFVFYAGSSAGILQDYTTAIPQLNVISTAVIAGNNLPVGGYNTVDKVEVVPYFIDNNGDPQLCTNKFVHSVEQITTP